MTPPLCTGTGCQGPPEPAPTFATPSSVTFNGPGNFPPPVAVTVRPKVAKCKKGDVKKKGKCVRKAKAKKKRAAKGKRASRGRRGQS